MPLSGPLLKQKAEELAKQLEYKNWVCSDGWLHRWKQRNSIVYRTISGEGNLVCPNTIHQWQKDTMTPFLKDFAPDDIFNAAETGVFWRLLPSKTFCFKGETCQDGKKIKERVTVLLCMSEYLSRDTVLATSEELNNEAIIIQVQISEDNDCDIEDIDDQGDELPLVSHKQAREALNNLGNFILHSGQEEGVIGHLRALQMFLEFLSAILNL